MAAADEVVQDHDLLGAGEHQLVGEIGTDRAGTAGHEHLAELGHLHSSGSRGKQAHAKQRTAALRSSAEDPVAAGRCLEVQEIPSTMKLLVAPHDLNIGGSQINAIDLAAGAAEAGHDVDRLRRARAARRSRRDRAASTSCPRGRSTTGPRPRGSRSSARSRGGIGSTSSTRTSGPRASTRTTARIWCWACRSSAPCCRCPCRRSCRARSRWSWAPRRSATRRARRIGAPVWVLEPPIDVEGDHPGIDGTAFRRDHGVADDVAADRDGLAARDRPQARRAGPGHRRGRPARRPATGAPGDRRRRAGGGRARAIAPPRSTGAGAARS